MADDLPTEADSEAIDAQPTTASPVSLSDSTVRASDLSSRGLTHYTTPAASAPPLDVPPAPKPDPVQPTPDVTPPTPQAAPAIPNVQTAPPPAVDPVDAARAQYSAARQTAAQSMGAVSQKLSDLGFPAPPDDSLADPGALHTHVQASINAALASPQANEQAAFGPAKFTPDATRLQENLAGLRDQATAAIGDHAQALAGLKSSYAALQQAQQPPPIPGVGTPIPAAAPISGIQNTLERTALEGAHGFDKSVEGVLQWAKALPEWTHGILPLAWALGKVDDATGASKLLQQRTEQQEAALAGKPVTGTSGQAESLAVASPVGNVVSKVAGGLIGQAPSIAMGGIPGLLSLGAQSAAQSSAEAHDAAKAQGMSDGDATKAGTIAALKTLPSTALFGLAGGATSKTLAKILPLEASPIARAAAALVTGTAANVAAGAIGKGVVGDNPTPTLDDVVNSIVFAAHGGMTEHQKAQDLATARSIISGTHPEMAVMDGIAQGKVGQATPEQQASAAQYSNAMRAVASNYIEKAGYTAPESPHVEATGDTLPGEKTANAREVSSVAPAPSAGVAPEEARAAGEPLSPVAQPLVKLGEGTPAEPAAGETTSARPGVAEQAPPIPGVNDEQSLQQQVSDATALRDQAANEGNSTAAAWHDAERAKAQNELSILRGRASTTEEGTPAPTANSAREEVAPSQPATEEAQSLSYPEREPAAASTQEHLEPTASESTREPGADEAPAQPLHENASTEPQPKQQQVVASDRMEPQAGRPEPEVASPAAQAPPIPGVNPVSEAATKTHAIANAALNLHADALTALGHPQSLEVGSTNGSSGLETDVQSERIRIDPEKLAAATKAMNPQQKTKFIKRAVAEEVIHLGTVKYAKESQDQQDKLLSLTNDKELMAQTKKAYGSTFDGLDDFAKAAEAARVLIQGPGKVTEASYKWLKDFLKWLQSKLKNLPKDAQDVVDGIKKKLGQYESSPKAEVEPPSSGQAEEQSAVAERPPADVAPKAEAVPVKSGDILHSAKQVKLTVPKGATFIRATPQKGNPVVEHVNNIGKGDNVLQGAGPYRKVEAGVKDRTGKFLGVKGDVIAEDKNKTVAASNPSENKPTPETPGSPATEAPSQSPANSPLDVASKEDTGKPEDGNTASEKLIRQADEAGVRYSLETLKGMIRGDEKTMERVRAQIREKGLKPIAAANPEENKETGPFYSQLTRTLERVPQETLTVQQARAFINKGAKPDEIAQQGILTDPLSPLYGKADNDRVTKSDLLGYSLERQAKVQDVVLGEYAGSRPDYKEARAKADAAHARIVELDKMYGSKEWDGREKEWESKYQKEFDAHVAAEDSAKATMQEIINKTEGGKETHFSSYQLPGADEGSYRESFVTWPKPKDDTASALKQWQGVKAALKQLDDLGFENTNEAWRAVVTHDDYAKRWDVPADAAAIFDAYKVRQVSGSGWKDGHSQYADIANPIVRIRSNTRTDANGKKTFFIEELQGPGKSEQEKMPPELRKRIYEIGMKRAIRAAVDSGADNIGWTEGKDQIQRYDDEFRRVADKVEWSNKDADGDRRVTVTKDGKSILMATERDGVLRNASVPQANGKSVEESLGKAVSEKLKQEEAGSMTGNDLSVGGQGLKNLYDVMLPRIANKLAEKVGGKVGGGTVITEASKEMIFPTEAKARAWAEANLGDHSYRIEPGGNENKFAVYDEFSHQFAKGQDNAPIHSMPLPEAWKQQPPSFSLYAANPAANQPVSSWDNIHSTVAKLKDNSGWTSVVDDVQKALSPDSRLTTKEREEFVKTGDPNAIGDARKASILLDGITAAMARRKQQWEAALKGAKSLVDTLPEAQQRELMLRMDEGTPIKPGSYKAAMEQIIAEDKKKVDEAKAWFDTHGQEHWGNYENYLKNIVPRQFEDPELANKVTESYIRERKMLGKTGWLKHRQDMTMREIMDYAASRGTPLTPKHANVVDAIMDRWEQQERYFGAHDMIDRMEKMGVGHWEPTDYEGRPGEKQVNNIIGQRTAEVPNDKGETSRQKQYFWAQEPAAQILNNYLSRGLRSGHKWIENYFVAANLLNSAQLGLSFFHGGFVTMEGMVSGFSRGIQKVLSGDMSGLKDMATAPFSTWHDWKLGGKIRDEMLNPGKYGEQMQGVVNAMVEGGFRDGLDSFYQDNHINKMLAAFKDKKYVPAALRAPMALIEAAAKPIMEHFVPRMKAAAVYRLAEMHLKDNPNITPMEMRRRLQEDVRSGNNRFGQYTYDNLHLHKTVKDLLMMLTRSLGWNWGTFSEIGGGIADWAKAIPQAGKVAFGQGQMPRITNKMAYTLGLPVLVGLMGAVLSAMFRQKPEQLKDYYFVKTGEVDERGNPIRVSLPSYMKDVFHAANDPKSTVTNKLHPLLSTLGDMLHNKDFYGVEIRHSGDPVMKQILQELGFAGKQFIPFTYRNAATLHESKAPLALQAAGLVGVTKAPASVNKSSAQALADQINSDARPNATRTSEQAEHGKLRSRLTGMLRIGKGQDELTTALRNGDISPKEAVAIQHAARMTTLQASVNHLSLNDAERVYEKASPDEKKQLEPILLAKRDRATRPMIAQNRMWTPTALVR